MLTKFNLINLINRLLNKLDFGRLVLFLSIFLISLLGITFFSRKDSNSYLDLQSEESLSTAIGLFSEFDENVQETTFNTILELGHTLRDNSEEIISFDNLKKIYPNLTLEEVVPFDNGIFRIEYRHLDDRFFVFLNTSVPNALEIFQNWMSLVDEDGKYADKLYIYDKIEDSQSSGPPVTSE